MSAIYAVWYRPKELHSEDDPTLCGIYTTRTIALDVARRALADEEDETYIREHFLNQFGPGETIWTSECEKSPEFRQFYTRFWPVGFPD